MSGGINGWVEDRWLEGWMDGEMDGEWLEQECMDGGMIDGWVEDQWMDGWRRDGWRGDLYHGRDSLLSLFAFLWRLQEVLQDLVVSSQL